jgi:hypothetical protein
MKKVKKKQWRVIYPDREFTWTARFKEFDVSDVDTLENYINQSLCGGYLVSDDRDEDEISLERVIAGTKPSALLYALGKTKRPDKETRDLHSRAKKAGLIVSPIKSTKWDGCYQYKFWVSRYDKLGDVPKFKKIVRAYKRNGFEGAAEDLEFIADAKASYFFKHFDELQGSPWMGIMLGYPVQLTMEILKYGCVHSTAKHRRVQTAGFGVTARRKLVNK